MEEYRKNDREIDREIGRKMCKEIERKGDLEICMGDREVNRQLDRYRDR